MNEKCTIIVFGGGESYINSLLNLAQYTDICEIIVFKEVVTKENEDLFQHFTVIPFGDFVNTSFHGIFITPGLPLSIKEDLLKFGATSSQIYTEMDSLLFFIKTFNKNLFNLNIGTFRYNVEAKSDSFHEIFIPTNDLEMFFTRKTPRPISRWAHCFEIYERHFSKYRNTDITVVEIGVYKGGSLQMWKDYFGSACKIIGVDIDPCCKAYEDEQIQIKIGSQEDREFWQKLKMELPKIDIVIDDGGHTMSQQIVTFEELYPVLSDNGVYLCEDLHTSYWPKFGGGYKGSFKIENTFIEYSKNFIDYINSWHFSELDDKKDIQNFKQSTHSLHYYDSVLVIEKRRMRPPISIVVGDNK